MISMAFESDCMRALNHDRDIHVNTNVMQFQHQITTVMTIAQRTKIAREKIGLKQEELAKKAGVSQGTIANIEAGHRKRPRDILSIAKALGVDPAWLESGSVERIYGRADEAVKVVAKEDHAPYDWPFKTVTKAQWESIPKHKRDVIEEQVRAMASNAASSKRAA
jgi:transcriptional regulator with XRE-family HTH domain